MLELYIKNKEILDLFVETLGDAGLRVIERKFLGFRLRPESGVIEVTTRNVTAIVRAIAQAAGRNPEGQLEFREMFTNNTSNWLVGPAAGKNEKKEKPVKK